MFVVFQFFFLFSLFLLLRFRSRRFEIVFRVGSLRRHYEVLSLRVLDDVVVYDCFVVFCHSDLSSDFKVVAVVSGRQSPDNAKRSRLFFHGQQQVGLEFVDLEMQVNRYVEVVLLVVVASARSVDEVDLLPSFTDPAVGILLKANSPRIFDQPEFELLLHGPRIAELAKVIRDAFFKEAVSVN